MHVHACSIDRGKLWIDIFPGTVEDHYKFHIVTKSFPCLWIIDLTFRSLRTYYHLAGGEQAEVSNNIKIWSAKSIIKQTIGTWGTRRWRHFYFQQRVTYYLEAKISKVPCNSRGIFTKFRIIVQTCLNSTRNLFH